MICAVIANVMGGGRRFEPRDFLPKWGGEPQSDEQLLTIAQDIFGQEA